MTARRVLYVEEAFGFGGSTSSLLGLVRHLDRRRYEATVVVAYPATRLGDLTRGVRLISLPARRAGAAGGAERKQRLPARVRFVGRLIRDVVPRAVALARLGKRERVDLVHVNNNLRLNLAGILAARLLRVPCVAHIRNFERINAVSRWGFRQAAWCITMSDAVRRHMIGEGLDPARITRVWSGLSAEEIRRPVDGIGFRRALGLPGNRLVYGLVSMLVRWKGHELFLRAARRIKDAVPEAVACIVGDTPVPNDPYRRELEAYANALGLDGHVRFTGFWADPFEVMAGLDVVVHASTAPEPFGRVVIEAMSLGRAIVAAGAGGPLEIITEDTGRLFTPGDEQGLADGVLTLLRDPETRARLGRAARRHVTNTFRAEREAFEVQAIYDRLLESGE